MGSVATTALCFFCLAQSPDASGSVPQWGGLIEHAAAKYGLPQSWIAHVMKLESGGQTILDGQPITSAAGAMGLMQVMPTTYSDMRRRYGLGSDPYDPANNIEAGTAYLRELYGRYGYPALFVAYNAGPKRYEELLLKGRSIPRETLTYVEKLAPGLSAAFQTKGAAVESETPLQRNGLFFYHVAMRSADQESTMPLGNMTSTANDRRLFFMKNGPG